ncbi:early flowering 4, partial [Genlisea aurea]
DGGDNQAEEDYCRDPEAMEILNKNFAQVQPILDRNRTIIQQVNDSHAAAGTSASNSSMNARLIRELHENISLIARLYSDMSKRFIATVKERRRKTA